jgi:uncharacterized repeat protein (TIGR03803 family)
MQRRSRFLSALAASAALLLIVAVQAADAATPAATKETAIYNFQPNTDDNPFSGLVADSAGNLYGVAVPGGAGGIVFELSPPAVKGGSWTETTLVTLNGTSDGNTPWSALVRDSKGNLYGTTEYGGSGSCEVGGVNMGCGVVFEVSESGGTWTETVLYNFQGGTDGRNPAYSPLILDTEGNLYGVTGQGGSTGCQKQGCGVLFELTPPTQAGGSWTETVLHRFFEKEGTFPGGPLLDMGGALYGTTAGGGAYGHGSVFEMNAKRTVSVVYSLHGTPDGSDNFPSGLAVDSSGDLYGFTYTGGESNYGTVFELTPSGGAWTESVLYSFTGDSDGGEPMGPPVLDKAGNLYGMSQAGGNLADCAWTAQQDGCGVVFKLAHPAQDGGAWKESVLHTFTNSTSAENPDGAFPSAGVIFGKGGDLYGATPIGGTGVCDSGMGSDLGCGIAFAITP